MWPLVAQGNCVHVELDRPGRLGGTLGNGWEHCAGEGPPLDHLYEAVCTSMRGRLLGVDLVRLAEHALDDRHLHLRHSGLGLRPRCRAVPARRTLLQLREQRKEPDIDLACARFREGRCLRRELRCALLREPDGALRLGARVEGPGAVHIVRRAGGIVQIALLAGGQRCIEVREGCHEHALQDGALHHELLSGLAVKASERSAPLQRWQDKLMHILVGTIVFRPDVKDLLPSTRWRGHVAQRHAAWQDPLILRKGRRPVPRVCGDRRVESLGRRPDGEKALDVRDWRVPGDAGVLRLCRDQEPSRSDLADDAPGHHPRTD
mmetsp:Transcript_12009/g.32950  ORF Transcript_12009/g.32950 Transcript_12009/m.32950 type:complete len:320 (-) Transcript_12009:31-990(-)